MKEITITPEHLDKAIAQSWSTKTCLMTQVGMDLGLKPVDHAFGTSVGTRLNGMLRPVTNLMREFDAAWQQYDDYFDLTKIKEIRKQLPKTFRLDDEDFATLQKEYQ